MKKNIILFAFGLLATTLIFAQRPHKGDHRKGERPQPNPELRKEMQSYIEKNIAPVLLKKQNEFDSKLSKEDLVFIQNKRKEVKADRVAHHEARAAKRAERKAMSPEERKAMKEKFQKMTDEERAAWKKEKHADKLEMKTKHKASRAEVKAFMERNQELIKTTMVDLKPQYKKWIADQKIILKKYHPEKAEKMAEEGHQIPRIGLFGIAPPHHKRGRHMKGEGKRGKHKMEKGDRKEKHHNGEKMRGKKGKHGKKHFGKRGVAIQFVLWDGTLPPAESRDESANALNNTGATQNAKILLGQNYPNPVRTSTQINVTIPEGISELKLVVSNIQGKVVRRISLSDLSAGTETIELQVGDLPNGQYFYTLEGQNINESKSMTISH